ncbi:MAG TPA: response regulator [Ktedonobacteraceae bacterium]
MSQQLRNLHILLVDGDPQVRDRVQQALGSGFSLRFARSLAEARRCLEEYLPDVLVCEVLLPDASGLEVCRQIRLSPALQHLPIMLLTTLSTISDKVAGFDAGADDYVVKPFDARYLTGRVRLLSRIKHMEYGHA